MEKYLIGFLTSSQIFKDLQKKEKKSAFYIQLSLSLDYKSRKKSLWKIKAHELVLVFYGSKRKNKPLENLWTNTALWKGWKLN